MAHGIDDTGSERGSLTLEEQAMWRALGRVVQRLPRQLDDAMLRSTGLTMTEFSVLHVLYEAEDRTLRMSDLATSTGLSISRVSRVALAMEGRGWCSRRRDEEDGRSALATLTQSGVEEVQRAKTRYSDIARQHVLDLVPRESLNVLAEALTAIASRP
ncbi:MarR family winged helix-turn-helix transcriptional regulator [Lentzea sp. NPDC059081]|uniref:MarR family winged helix-turn-helix transcriptional regulator n=1 Tax=Lentzea sp. NPDC059081 TaxID=3346719 RepID=UPI0036880B8C